MKSTSHTSFSLVQVRFTIFDVGAVISDRWANEIDNQVLYLPPECSYMDDCLMPFSAHEVYVLNANTGVWELRIEHEWQFAKWAVAFDFTSIGEAVSGQSYSAKSAMEREVYDIGTQYLFTPFLEALIDRADDLIDQAAKNKSRDDFPIYEVCFVTLWQTSYFQSGWEYLEWDMAWDLIGRVDVDQLAAQILAGEKVEVLL